MRYSELLELAGVKRFRDMTASEILDYYKSLLGGGGRDIMVLGRGASGAALQIGNNVYKFWLVDSAYKDFVTYCLAHSNNPFLPRFLSGIKTMPAFFIRHEDAPDNVNYVKMEKLSTGGSRTAWYSFELNVEFHDEDDKDERGHLASVYLRDVMYIVEMIGNTEIPYQVEFLNRLNKSKGHTYKQSDLSSELVLIVDTLVAIKQLGHTLDLHGDNLMYRGEQLVILDPIANKDDLALNRAFDKFDQKLFHNPDDGKPAVMSKAPRNAKPTPPGPKSLPGWTDEDDKILNNMKTPGESK